MTLRESMAKLFSRKCVCLFYVIWLISSLAFLNACEYQKIGACNPDKKTVQEGDSLNVSLSNFGKIRDVCFWNSSVSKWVSTCQIDDQIDGEICKPLPHGFNVHIFLGNETLVISNMKIENSGDYRILDLSGNYLDITVSVSDSSSKNSGSRNISSWGVILPVLVLILFCGCCCCFY